MKYGINSITVESKDLERELEKQYKFMADKDLKMTVVSIIPLTLSKVPSNYSPSPYAFTVETFKVIYYVE